MRSDAALPPTNNKLGAIIIPGGGRFNGDEPHTNDRKTAGCNSRSASYGIMDDRV